MARPSARGLLAGLRRPPLRTGCRRRRRRSTTRALRGHVLSNECLLQSDHRGATCNEGFDGPACANDIDDCAAQPCLNGGTCVDAIASFSCECQGNWTGETCEEEICPTVTTHATSLSAGCSTSPVIEGILTISSPDGEVCIGTTIGVGDTRLDGKSGTESLEFTFSGPVTSVVVASQTASNGDGDGTIGLVDIAGWEGAEAVGEFTFGSPGDIEITERLGNSPITRFMIQATTSDTRSLSSVRYRTICQ